MRTGRRPTLSVCCLAGEPPAQVAEVLRLFRPLAAEVIVAADSRIDLAELAPYRAVADRLVRYEFAEQANRARPWLYAQCRSDWLFVIDGDEIPSPALIDALPDLIRRTDVMHVAFPRRWLYPDATHWLGELPWWPDFQVRLVRNGPTLRHTGHIHDSVGLTHPMDHVDLPIYHLALVSTDIAERRERSARYEAVSPGRAAYGGGQLNEVMYLPEVSATVPPLLVPPADLPWISRVLEVRGRPPVRSDHGDAIPLVGRDEIDRHVTRTDLADSDYRCRISAYAEQGRMALGEVRPVYVRIENLSGVTWQWGRDHDPVIGVGYHWVEPDGTTLPDDGRRSPLPATLHPGDALIVPTFVEAPRRPGNYVLELDLVHENTRWFGLPLSIDMRVDTSPTRRPVRSTTSMFVTTIVARNYLPRARILARSFREHHPDGRVLVLVIDADAEATFDEPFDIVRPGDLAIDTTELHRMAAIYDVLELATALKPFLLRHLLFDRDLPAVTYLDPDIEVLAPLDDLDALARRHSIVLTPHRLEPLPNDEKQPDARSLLRSGAFNLGYISVSKGAAEFLEQWSAHCRRDCIIAHDQGHFVDQRWVDAGILPHEHHILLDPGCNVAYWNLDARPITHGSDGYEVAGWPLRFIHYSGFDPAVPHLLSRHQGDRPRTLLSEHPALAELVARYARRIEEETTEPDIGYGWSLSGGGLELDHTIRRLFRDEVLRRELDESGRSGAVADLPDVFADGTDDGLVALLSSPLPGSPVPRVPRLLHHIYEQRPDVRQAYPNLRGDGLEAFFTWVRNSGQYEHDIPTRLVPSPSPNGARSAPRQRRGVNIVGYFTAELGVGEGGRALLAMLDQLDEPHAVINDTSTSNRQDHPVLHRFAEPEAFDINVLCVNSDQLPRVMEQMAGQMSRDQYTVGMWAWELEEFPPGMHAGVPYVDEIWTNSWHAVRAIARAVDKPVRHVPTPVVTAPAHSSPGGRHPLGIDAGFTFMFCFDFHSVPERKNPVAVVRAFREAFAPGEGPTLIVKSINGRSSLNALEELRASAGGRGDIHIVDRYLDSSQNRALIAGCDCYVSLHRAEGFGYTMAEAMLAGKPVIATGYSGNLDFMDGDNSFLVGYRPATVPPGCGSYPAGARWAEPDIDDAARLMRRVYGNRNERERVGRRAQRDIASRLSAEAVAPLVAARLADIRARSSADVVSYEPAPGSRVGQVAWRATRRAGRLMNRRSSPRPVQRDE